MGYDMRKVFSGPTSLLVAEKRMHVYRFMPCVTLEVAEASLYSTISHCSMAWMTTAALERATCLLTVYRTRFITNCDIHARFLQVWCWDVGCDGVGLRNFVMHSATILVIRCKDAPDDVVCKSCNVRPVLIIPGPRAPKKHQWRTYWYLIFSLMGMHSSFGHYHALPYCRGVIGCA
jgi:hypothetical protein